MNLTWHIVRKDLRRMAAPAGLWLALVVAASIWFRLQPFAFPGDAAGGPSPIVVSMCALVVIVQLLGLYVLGGALVMEDPIVSSTAFWQTRPISRQRLLLAKLLAGVVLFVAVPAACLAGVWLACGAGAQEIALAAAQCAALHGAVLLGAIAIASISTSLLQFLPWTLGFAAVWIVVVAWTDSLSRRVVRPAGMDANEIVGQALPACIVGLLLARFLTGRRALAALAFVGVLAIAVAIRVAQPFVATSRPESHRKVAPVAGNRIEHADANPGPFRTLTGTALRDREGAYRVPVTAWQAENQGSAAPSFVLDREKLTRVLATNVGTPALEWQMIAPEIPAHRSADNDVPVLSGTWASVAIAGETPLRVGDTIRCGASCLAIREITRWENGNRGILLEQHDLSPERLWGWRMAVTDEFVLVDRAHRRARVLDARLVDQGWLDWQRVQIVRVTVPANALPERESDARIVQVRFRSSERLPYVNTSGGAE